MARLTKRVGENITYNQERKIECSVYCDECSQGTANCKTIREMVKKLADYEDAEEQGLLVKIQCHCKDCKHWKDEVAGCTEHVKVCDIGGYMVGENGYCLYAEQQSKDRKRESKHE